MRRSLLYIILSISLSVLAQTEDIYPDIEPLLREKEESASILATSVASRIVENVYEAPGIITIIEREEIESYAHLSLMEVLEQVTNTFVFGTYSNPQNIVSVRGSLPIQNNNRCLILINGRPVREPYWGGMDFPVLLGFPVSIIEKIEVIRGPGSVIYGTNAYSGVINIVTEFSEVKGSNKITTGSFGGFGIDAFGALNQGEMFGNIGIKVFNEDGWPLEMIGEDLQPISMRMSEDNIGVSFNIKYNNFYSNAMFAYSDQGIVGHAPAQTNGLLPLRERRNEAFRIFYDMGYQHKFSNRLSSSVHFNYNHINHRTFLPIGQYQTNAEGLMLEQTNILEISDRSDMIFGATATLFLGINTISDTSRIINNDYFQTLYTAYAQNNWEINSYIKTIAGLQIKGGSIFPVSFTPRLGVIGRLNDRFNAKVLYANAFRTPFPAETDIQIPPTVIGNENLLPETINTLDIQLIGSFKHLVTQLTYFRSIENDAIVRRPALLDNRTVLQYQNQGKTTIQGVELENDLRWNNWSVDQSFSWNFINIGDTLDEGNLLPCIMAKVGVRYSSGRGNIGLLHSYYNDFGNVAVFNPSVLNVNPPSKPVLWGTLQATGNLNEIFGLDFNTVISVSGSVINLWNADFYMPEVARLNINTLPVRQGRSFYLTISASI